MRYLKRVMIIFLYGPDSYRRLEKLREIVSDYRKKHSGLSIQRFDVSDGSSFADFRDFLKSNSLFDPFKLGIVSGGEELDGSDDKDFRKLLKENLEIKESVLIVLFGKKPVKDYSFLLRLPAVFQEFENPEGAKFSGFAQKEAAKRGLKIDSVGIDLLARAFAGDNWGLVTELEKLSLLDGKNIDPEMIRSHLDVLGELEIFPALNLMKSSGSRGERLRVFEELSVRNYDPAMLFNMAAISPYEGKGWKEAMADYDAAVKSGKLEYEEVLLDMILK